MSVSPSDRNLIDAYIDGGVVFADLIPQRPDDRFGVSVIYASFSDSVRAFDRDTVLFTGVPGRSATTRPISNSPTWRRSCPVWTVQPNLQFVWHPNGDASTNATVLGLRSLWRY